MKVLVINAGSSSLKYQLIDTATETALAKGVADRIGKDDGIFKFSGKCKIEKELPIKDHVAAFDMVMSALTDKEIGVISDLKEIAAVGHRVLHGGTKFTKSVLMTDENMKICRGNEDLGPLHMPPNLNCIELAKKLLPHAPMVAVFDTVFHATMPEYAYRYAVPYEYLDKYQIRKYGFHGTSHQFVTGEAIKRLGNPAHSKIITCHLGNGSSLAAVKDGKCIDTTMGLTPLEGLVMGTRSGDIDAAAVEYICRKTGMSVSETLNVLNKDSGLQGLCGASDFRDLEKLYNAGDEKAVLACEMFGYRFRKYIGSYYVALGGLDALVMTGGIGENSAFGRSLALKGLECLGIKMDEDKNRNFPMGTVGEIAAADSEVAILIQPTNEELVIARETAALSEGK